MEGIIIFSLIVWGIALIGLCSRRDIDPHDKITWLAVILVLNVVGAIIYFIFSPKYEPSKNSSLPKAPDDSKPIHPEHMKSWNTFIGYNQNAPGEGLNPASDGSEK